MSGPKRMFFDGKRTLEDALSVIQCSMDNQRRSGELGLEHGRQRSCLAPSEIIGGAIPRELTIR